MKTAPHRHVGLDFGTTNSAVAVARPYGAELARFETRAGGSATFPSVLYFERQRHATGSRIASFAGPYAISQYLYAEEKGRLIQSLKAYLGDRRFGPTTVFSSTLSLSDLIALIVKQMLSSAGLQAEALPTRAIIGRPVHFTSARDASDDEFALARLVGAIRQCGFEEVVAEYEPVAAAYSYEQRLTRDETILIGDFGGGTSDFSILRVGPGIRSRGRTRADIIGSDGVAVAGDSFDRHIVRQLVAPHLGLGSDYVSPPDKVLPVPSWPYERLERWHHLSFLNNDRELDALELIRARALTPARLQAFIDVIRDGLGYQLHEAVRRTKFALSSAMETVFKFTAGDIDIVEPVTRRDFEGWIAEDLAAITQCVDGLIERTGVPPSEIDHVFLTGGSSFVPSVRRIFTERFGQSKITGGGELTSVATGLALRAAEQWGDN